MGVDKGNQTVSYYQELCFQEMNYAALHLIVFLVFMIRPIMIVNDNYRAKQATSSPSEWCTFSRLYNQLEVIKALSEVAQVVGSVLHSCQLGGSLLIVSNLVVSIPSSSHSAPSKLYFMNTVEQVAKQLSVVNFFICLFHILKPFSSTVVLGRLRSFSLSGAT